METLFQLCVKKESVRIISTWCSGHSRQTTISKKLMFRIFTLFGLSSEKRVATRFDARMILREPFPKLQRPVLVSIVAENRTACSPQKKSSVVKSQGREARARACKSIRDVFYAF
jgi:hypothetical protein